MEPDISTLLCQKNKILENISTLNYQLRLANQELENIKNVILKTCQHEWKRDNANCGPYDKPDYYCEKCGSIDYRW
jgi:hypothetical protein